MEYKYYLITPTGYEEEISRSEYMNRKAEVLEHGDFGGLKYEARLVETDK